METSIYYDFSQKKVKEWIKQAKDNKNVLFYYDEKNKAYCREIRNVRGKIIKEKGQNIFTPDEGQLVTYGQIIR